MKIKVNKTPKQDNTKIKKMTYKVIKLRINEPRNQTITYSLP